MAVHFCVFSLRYEVWNFFLYVKLHGFYTRPALEITLFGMRIVLLTSDVGLVCQIKFCFIYCQNNPCPDWYDPDDYAYLYDY